MMRRFWETSGFDMVSVLASGSSFRLVVSGSYKVVMSRAQLLLVVFISLACGCSRIMGPKPPAPIPSYGDGEKGLAAYGKDVLAAAKAGECERIHELFASLAMTRAELDLLFGARAAELAPPYGEMMDTLTHLGAVDLCALVYERKYDLVETLPVLLDDFPIGPRFPHSPVYADEALARSLVTRPRIYKLRFAKKGQEKSTTYDFFWFHDDRWRSGNLLGYLLDKRDLQLTRDKMAR